MFIAEESSSDLVGSAGVCECMVKKNMKIIIKGERI
jgi:hypothetical protein